MKTYKAGDALWVYDEQWEERVGFTISAVEEVDEYTTNLNLQEVDGDRSLEITATELSKRIKSGSAGEPGRGSR